MLIATNCWTDGEVAVLEDTLHWFLVLRGRIAFLELTGQDYLNHVKFLESARDL